MNNTTLYIKNMVCNRCIMVVQDLLGKLGFTVLHIELGKVLIQETPEKTEAEKPSEPPALSEGTATDQPDTPPSYEEEKQEEPAPAENQTPKTGDTKDGMVYVEGFGWITDEGEGSGIYADDMYENGNKIGIMD